MKVIPDDGVIGPHVQRDLPVLGLHDPPPQPLAMLPVWAGFLQVPWPAPVWKIEPVRDDPVQWRAVAAERRAVRPTALDPPHVPAQFHVSGRTVERQGNLALTVGELRSFERIIDCPLDRHVRDKVQLYASGYVSYRQPTDAPAVKVNRLRGIVKGVYGTQGSLAACHDPIMPVPPPWLGHTAAPIDRPRSREVHGVAYLCCPGPTVT